MVKRRLITLSLTAVLIAGLLPPLPAFEVLAQQPEQKVILREGTPVRIRLSMSVSSEVAQVGDTVAGEAAEAVTVDGKTIIAQGAKAWGRVTVAQRRGPLGRPGRIGFTFDYVQAVDGTNVPLRATAERVGQGKEGWAWGLGLLIFLPFLLIKGGEIIVREGTIFTAYANRDVTVTLSPIPASPPLQEPKPSPEPSPSPSDTGGGS